MSTIHFQVKTWTKGRDDLEVKFFASKFDAVEYAEGSHLHGYEIEVSEVQPDLFDYLQITQG